MAKTFAIIDGSSCFYRAFYAIPRLTNSKGMPTNAAMGFAKMLLRVQKQLKPDYLAVVFDKAEKTFRNDLYKDYKAHRPPMPDGQHKSTTNIGTCRLGRRRIVPPVTTNVTFLHVALQKVT